MAKWITIFLAVIGLAFGVWTVMTSGDHLPDTPPARPPSINPFGTGIAASGVVEAASRNISIMAPEPGLVIKVLTDVNQVVKAGDPLFILDTRQFEADLVNAQAELIVAKAELDMVNAKPRAEDLPPLQAAVKQAAVQVADLEDIFERTAEMLKGSAATEGELKRRQFALDAAKASLAVAQSKLDQAKAGAWSMEVEVAKSKVAKAEAMVQSIKLRIERLTVRSPIDATILRRSIEPGEYIAVAGGSPAMVIGDISSVHIRAQVDEEDAPLLIPGARAKARIRGSEPREYTLKMLRIEPMAHPKLELIGSTQERVDTRVVEAVFEVERSYATWPYLGQVVDVFIETKESPSTQSGR